MGGAKVSPRFRASERLSLTLPWSVLQDLQQRAFLEGRSTSNLAAYLIERGLKSADHGESQ